MKILEKKPVGWAFLPTMVGCARGIHFDKNHPTKGTL